jgi:hypothetical protein
LLKPRVEQDLIREDDELILVEGHIGVDDIEKEVTLEQNPCGSTILSVVPCRRIAVSGQAMSLMRVNRDVGDRLDAAGAPRLLCFDLLKYVADDAVSGLVDRSGRMS